MQGSNCRRNSAVTYLDAIRLDSDEAVSYVSMLFTAPEQLLLLSVNLRLLGSHGGDGMVFGVLLMELVFRPRSMAQWQAG